MNAKTLTCEQTCKSVSAIAFPAKLTTCQYANAPEYYYCYMVHIYSSFIINTHVPLVMPIHHSRFDLQTTINNTFNPPLLHLAHLKKRRRRENFYSKNLMAF